MPLKKQEAQCMGANLLKETGSAGRLASVVRNHAGVFPLWGNMVTK